MYLTNVEALLITDCLEDRADACTKLAEKVRLTPDVMYGKYTAEELAKRHEKAAAECKVLIRRIEGRYA